MNDGFKPERAKEIVTVSGMNERLREGKRLECVWLFLEGEKKRQRGERG